MSSKISAGTIKRLLWGAGLGAAVVLGASVINMGRAADAPAPAQRLPAPDHVSQETRTELKARMARHGETMSSLVRSVVLLDRPTIRILANRIADEEIVARVGTGGPKRPPLPPEFFAAQDELSASARQLAVAAKQGGDDRAIADGFAAVTRTCVTCHSAYLHGRPEPSPAGAAPK